MAAKRPEHTGPPDLFYSWEEAQKYAGSSRMVEIQSAMTERALQLLALPGSEEGDDGEGSEALLLDIGCGSGLSAQVLADAGHHWIGIDIAPAMLQVGLEREVEDGEFLLSDAGQGLQFRPGSFDGAVSISALQWLCQADSRVQSPRKRLRRLFTALYASLRRGARAVFQWYPENSAQVELVTSAAMRSGFTGGLVVDYPNSAKAKKVFLVLSAGGAVAALPAALTGEEGNSVGYEGRTGAKGFSSKGGKAAKGSRAWIEARKERDRRKGRHVPHSSKYTGRRRKAL